MDQLKTSSKSSTTSNIYTNNYCDDSFSEEFHSKLFEQIFLDRQIIKDFIQLVNKLQAQKLQKLASQQQKFISDQQNNEDSIKKVLLERIDMLTKKSKQQKDKINECNKLIQTSKDQITKLLKQNQQKTQKIKILQNDIKAKEETIIELNKSVGYLKSILQSFNRIGVNIQDKIKQSSKQKFYQELHIDQSQLNNVKESINQAKFVEQIQNLERLLKIYEFVHYDLIQSQKKDKKINQMETQIENLKQQLRGMQAKNIQKQQQLKRVNLNIVEFTNILGKKCTQISEWEDIYLKQLNKISKQSKLKNASQSFKSFCKQIYADYQFHKNKLTNSEKQREKQRKKLVAANDEKQNQITNLKEIINNLDLQCKNKISNLTEDSNKQKLKLQSEIKKLKQQKDKLDLDYKQSIEKIDYNNKQKVAGFQNQILALEQQKLDKQKYCKKIELQNSQIKQKVQKLQNKIKKMVQEHQQRKSLDENNHQLINKQLLGVQNRNNTLLQDISKAKIQIKDLIQKNDVLVSDYQKALAEIDNLKQLNREAQSNLTFIFQNVSQISCLLSNKKVQVDQMNMQNRLNQIKSNIFNLLNSSPFLSESAILDYRKDKLKINFIKNSTEKFKNAKIKGCQLVYRKDAHKSNINMHAYIDGTQDLMLIVHLANGRIIGGFTAKPFIKNNTEKHSEAFLFVADTQSIYFMKPQANQAITYDEYYIIWGNSQIRIRFGEDLVFSNFGILNSFYDNKKAKVQEFLGYGNQREITMNTFEFYKIKFD